jgi:hypothetical protein
LFRDLEIEVSNGGLKDYRVFDFGEGFSFGGDTLK